MNSFYKSAGQGAFEALEATAGPWGRQFQHAGPPSALLVKAIEDNHVAVDQRIGRVSVDVLVPVPLAPITVDTSVIRPGKRTALFEAIGYSDDRAVICVRAWRFPRIGHDYPTTDDPTPQPLTEAPTGEDGGQIPGASAQGYLSSTEFRFTHGSFAEFGPAAAWARSNCTLVPNEPLTPWQSVIILADSSSGISLAAPPRQYPAINSDLLVVLHRDPVGEWIHIDSTTRSTRDSGAATYAQLSDQAGQIGTCTQTLYATVTR